MRTWSGLSLGSAFLSVALTASAVFAAGPATSRPYNEALRPQFHFTAARNWLNDPNGLVFHEGEYHLFFQHNPSGINWGNMTWGHAVSPDLVHWRQLDHALLPDKLGTVFSGSAVVDQNNTAGFQKGSEKTLIALYTAAGGTSPESKGVPFSQCLAWSNDRGRTWTKYEHNPVLANIIKENRDPKVVWHAATRTWIMALYKDGEVFGLFSSPDLKNWSHLHDITMPGCGECPDFFELAVNGDPRNTRWVFTAANGHYLVGAFDGRRFTPEGGPRPADWGGNYYAVQTWSDVPDGRRIQIAWMRGGEYPGMPFNQQMSFPCELTLRTVGKDLVLHRTPVSEICHLYRATHESSGVLVRPGENPLADVHKELLDLTVEIAPEQAGEVGFVVRGHPLTYEPAHKKLTCMNKSAQVEPVDGRLELRLLIDRSSLEVFANEGRTVMSFCFVPKAGEPVVACYAKGGTARLHALTVNELSSAWEPWPAK